MQENWNSCFDAVLQHEGGYVNDPRDPGGRTNLGVTQRAWEAYWNRSSSEEEMRKLTPNIVKPFYKSMYWDKIRGDQLPSGVDYAAYDLAVNSGVGRASKYLQEIAGVVADGVIGPKSLEAIKACNSKELVDSLCDMRLDFLKRLPTFATFGKGWSRRVAEVKEKALSMTSEGE
jgi:lysozyme family protein